MAKYGFSTTIPYGTEMFEVTGVEYCEWEDGLESVDDTDINGIEWVTYDFLINNGYFVSKPKNERPITAEQAEQAKPKKLANKGKTKTETTTKSRNPGATAQAEAFDNSISTLVSGATREPVWTQSRIFAERDKLLREREKITSIKEKALGQKIIEQQIIERFRAEPQTSGTDFASIVAVILVILMIMGGAVLGLVSVLT